MLIDGDKPEPLEVDDIVLSPDYQVGYTPALAEIKSTRVRLKDGALSPEKGWSDSWIKQMMGYAYAQHSADDSYRLAAFLVIPATIVARKFTFTVAELAEFWQSILVRKARYLEAKAAGKPPEPYAYTDSGQSTDWQCEHCAYRIFCAASKGSGEYIKKEVASA